MSKGVTRRRRSERDLNFSGPLRSARRRDRWKAAGFDRAAPFPWHGRGWGFDSGRSLPPQQPLDLSPAAAPPHSAMYSLLSGCTCV